SSRRICPMHRKTAQHIFRLESEQTDQRRAHPPYPWTQFHQCSEYQPPVAMLGRRGEDQNLKAQEPAPVQRPYLKAPKPYPTESLQGSNHSGRKREQPGQKFWEPSLVPPRHQIQPADSAKPVIH